MDISHLLAVGGVVIFNMTFSYFTKISLIPWRSTHLDNHKYKYTHSQRRLIGVEVCYLFYLTE